MEQQRKSGSKEKAARGRVYFIGSGPGDPELITIKGRKVIAQADLIIYAGSLVNPLVFSGARKSARILDSASMTLEEVAVEMTDAAQRGKIVARLHSGDPSIYGAIAEQMNILKKERITYEVIPGVTSAFAAAAALKKEFTVPGFSQTLIITRRAGRTPVPERESLTDLAAHRASMAIFLSTSMIDETIRELIKGGYPPDTPVAVVSRASWPEETVIRGTLASIAAKVKTAHIKRQAVILVGDAIGDARGERSRLYDGEFAHGFRDARIKRRAGPAVIAVTAHGMAIGKQILRAMKQAHLFIPASFKKYKDSRISCYANLEQEMSILFKTYRKIICIMAAGIAVRMVAPYLKSKWEDPAVVVMDDQGKNIISLLSGHWGGANELTRDLAQLLGGHRVITTASDTRGLPALDVMIKELGADDFSKQKLKKIQAAMIAGQPVGFYPRELSSLPEMQHHDNLYFYNTVEKLLASNCSAGLGFAHDKQSSAKLKPRFLIVHLKDVVIGIGCNKGIAVREIKDAISTVLRKLDMPAAAICALCTIAAKSGEKGLVEYAAAQGIPLKFYNPAELNSVKIISRKSIHAQRAFGVQGVAEPSAILGSQGGQLLLKKVKLRNITLAVARMPFDLLIKDSRGRGDG
jgi:precorrin-4 C11-methyltransferase